MEMPWKCESRWTKHSPEAEAVAAIKRSTVGIRAARLRRISKARAATLAVTGNSVTIAPISGQSRSKWSAAPRAFSLVQNSTGVMQETATRSRPADRNPATSSAPASSK